MVLALIVVTVFALVIAAVLSFAGVVVGRRVGARFGKPAEIAGGVVLILIGVNIVLEHTGVIG